MTDHVKEIVQQIVAAAGDPLATLESVGGRLNHLYQQAEAAGDASSMQVIGYAWTEIQQMNEQTTTVAGLAAAAKKVADEITLQRDALAKQHGELVKDINDVNTSNPLVDKVYQAAEQAYEEDLMYSETFVSSDPADDIISNVNAIPVTYPEANDFFHMLMGGYEITEDQAQRLADFIQQFVQSVHDEENEEIDMDTPDEAA